MTLGASAQWFAFAAFSLIALAGALGMATTMSMFRSGIFLMASFLGVAGLFILLSADLLALLQVMMYIGGMLVMILFMVLFSNDPGGSMMASMMKLPLIERFFSSGLEAEKMKGGQEGHEGHGMQGTDDKGQEREAGHEGMQHGKEGKGHGQGTDMGGMDMQSMSMTTPIKRQAAALAVLIGVILTALLALRPAWPVSQEIPDPRSAEKVGSLLMSKYMMAFEGAGLLILIGIFGAVLMARSGHLSDRTGRDAYVSDKKPPPGVKD